MKTSLKEFENSEYENIRATSKRLVALGRYTNLHGCRFYLFRYRELFSEDYQSWQSIVFLAVPKKYNPKLPAEPALTWKLSIHRMASSELRAIGAVDNYLIGYGPKGFKAWLNENRCGSYADICQIEVTRQIRDSSDPLAPVIRDGKLMDAVVDEEDEERLRRIAKTELLRFYSFRETAWNPQMEEIAELCFVPDFTAQFTMNYLAQKGYIADGRITSDGIDAYNGEVRKSRSTGDVGLMTEKLVSVAEALSKPPQPKEKISLSPGRNQTALTERQIRTIRDSFSALGYEGKLLIREGPATRSVFKVEKNENDEDEGVILVGADILPGENVSNPNSMLDQIAAIAHEITHYNRWKGCFEQPIGDLDEAMTSLQAICYFREHLNRTQLEQLATDALERLGRFSRQQGGI